MGNEIRESIAIIIELIVFSALLSIVIVLGQQGRSLLATHEDNKAIAQEMRAYQEFSNYDNRELTGDDMVLAIKKYSKAYNVCIVQDPNNDGVFDELKRDVDNNGSIDLKGYYSKNTGNTTTHWKEENIRLLLGDLIYSTYTARFLTIDEINRTDYTSVYPTCVDSTDPTIPTPSSTINDEILIFELII